MIRVKSLGTVTPTAASVAMVAGKPVLIPTGYMAERPVFAPPSVSGRRRRGSEVVLAYRAGAPAPAEDSHTDESTPLFTFAVTSDSDGGLVFTITRSDDPAGKQYTSTGTPTTAWRAAILAAAEDFPTRAAEGLAQRGTEGSLQISGLRLAGLALAEIAAEVARLPGAAEALAAHAAAHASADTVPSVQPTQDSDVEVELSIAAAAIQVGAQGDSQGGGGGRTRRPVAKRSRTTSAAPSQTAVAEGVTANVPPKRPRKASALRGSCTAPPSAAADAAPASVAAGPVAAVAVCADCGLADTPFCALTGKPHTAPPCDLCGLTTAFCPNTGLPHEGAVQRVDRQRGEVRLPTGTARKSRRPPQTATAAPGSAPEAEVTVVDASESATGVAAKPRRRRNTSTSTPTATTDGGGDANLTGSASVRVKVEAAPATAKSRAGRRKGEAGAATTSARTPAARGQTTLDASLTRRDSATAELGPPSPRSFIYPPLRPPLSPAEQHRAAVLLPRAWRGRWEGEGEGGMLPAHVAALRLALVPHRLPKTSPVAAGMRRGKPPAGVVGESESGAQSGLTGEEGNGAGEGVEPEPVRVDTAEAAEDDADEAASVKAGTEDGEEAGVGGRRRARGGAAAAAATTIMVHPLDVRDGPMSAAGKRLTRFLLQYTSERTKLDALRSEAIAKKAEPASTSVPVGTAVKKEEEAVAALAAEEPALLSSTAAPHPEEESRLSDTAPAGESTA